MIIQYCSCQRRRETVFAPHCGVHLCPPFKPIGVSSSTVIRVPQSPGESYTEGIAYCYVTWAVRQCQDGASLQRSKPDLNLLEVPVFVCLFVFLVGCSTTFTYSKTMFFFHCLDIISCLSISLQGLWPSLSMGQQLHRTEELPIFFPFLAVLKHAHGRSVHLWADLCFKPYGKAGGSSHHHYVSFLLIFKKSRCCKETVCRRMESADLPFRKFSDCLPFSDSHVLLL